MQPDDPVTPEMVMYPAYPFDTSEKGPGEYLGTPMVTHLGLHRAPTDETGDEHTACGRADCSLFCPINRAVSQGVQFHGMVLMEKQWYITVI